MYKLNDEQEMILQVVREIASEKIAPRAAEIDAKGEFPWDILKTLVDADLLMLTVSPEYGGMSQGLLFCCMVIEELCKACASSGMILMIQSLAEIPIELAGSEEQKRRILPKMAAGEWLGAFALTEPQA